MTIRAAGNDPDGIVLRQRLAGGDRRVASQSYFTGCSSTAAASSIAGNGLMGNNIGVIIADKGEA